MLCGKAEKHTVSYSTPYFNQVSRVHKLLSKVYLNVKIKLKFKKQNDWLSGEPEERKGN